LENIDINNKKPSKFFRDHTLETTKENPATYGRGLINKENNINHNGDSNNLGSYLAGLIEGDGSIYIPKNDKSACMIVIVFNSKDFPLVLKIQNVLMTGNIYKRKGKNAYTYVISDIKGLIKIVNLINGKMRTPKIKQLYKLIDRINNKNYNLIKLPLDNSSLDSNA
jgi:hypothetical protein